MRLKYYLKGLGIGMILAALLMGLSIKEPVSMSDEEIKIRAKELGMVEQKTLADKMQDNAPQTTNKPLETEPPVATAKPLETKPVETEETGKDEEIREEEPNKETEESSEALQDVSIEPSEEESGKDELKTEEQIISFEIHKGESSDSISKRLEENGLVENAVSYNDYLCNKGYDRKLNIGIYKLSMGMTEEEIAKIITRTQ